jgi:hypothetical protein
VLDRKLKMAVFATAENEPKPSSTSYVVLQSVHGLVRRSEGMSCISVSAILTFSDGYGRPDSFTHHHLRRYHLGIAWNPGLVSSIMWHRLLAS